jgi:metal-responsive CopG/Arc/MetJ family transcriptional regulator
VTVNKKATGKKPRGAGKDPLIAVRLPPQLISRLDRYAKERKISRSEAVRNFVTRGLDDIK